MNEQSDIIEAYGICMYAMVPVRSEPSHRSELSTQLLFGETYGIADIKQEWTRIVSSFDSYEGWIESKQVSRINNKEYKSYSSVFGVAHEVYYPISHPSGSLNIPMGSSLPGIKDYEYGGSHLPPGKKLGRDEVCNLAKKLLSAPYLWGGRTHMGIDCSGLAQLAYKLSGYRIPRDSGEQAGIGTTINFISESRPGDLLFFDNEEGLISHVGIMLPENKIIHASGHVRIDRVDHQGIFNEETKSYTHNLRLIKSLLNE